LYEGNGARAAVLIGKLQATDGQRIVCEDGRRIVQRDQQATNAATVIARFRQQGF